MLNTQQLVRCEVVCQLEESELVLKGLKMSF